MERLTMWHDGCHAICFDEGCSSGSCPFADAPCERVQEVIDRLAAYEATGLEPKEIPTGLELANTYAAMLLLKRYQTLGPVEELSALAKAREEGRVTISPPPAKEGDPKPDCFEDYGGSVWCLGYQRSETDDEPCDRCKRCWYCEDGDYASDYTEAEAALGGGGDG